MPARIQIPLFREDGKTYTLCNHCGTKFRYKGGTAFCKPECQERWNVARDAISRRERAERERIAKANAPVVKPITQEEIDEQNRRHEEIRKMREEATAEREKVMEERKKYGHYRPRWRYHRWG